MIGLRFLSLAGLVAIAGGLNPIPSRTRPLISPAPMVLSLKTWKSRSLPGLPRTEFPLHDFTICELAAQGSAKPQSKFKKPPGVKPWRLFAVTAFGCHGRSPFADSLPFTFVHGNESDKV